MNSPRKLKSLLLDKIRRERDQVEFDQIKTSMIISHKIASAMRKKGLSKSQTAELFSQKPSVISKWLSGHHNFTANTLCEIGRKLGINFFAPEEIEQYTYQGMLQNDLVKNIFVFGDRECEQIIKVPDTIIGKVMTTHEDQDESAVLIWSASTCN